MDFDTQEKEFLYRRFPETKGTMGALGIQNAAALEEMCKATADRADIEAARQRALPHVKDFIGQCAVEASRRRHVAMDRRHLNAVTKMDVVLMLLGCVNAWSVLTRPRHDHCLCREEDEAKRRDSLKDVMGYMATAARDSLDPQRQVWARLRRQKEMAEARLGRRLYPEGVIGDAKEVGAEGQSLNAGKTNKKYLEAPTAITKHFAEMGDALPLEAAEEFYDYDCESREDLLKLAKRTGVKPTIKATIDGMDEHRRAVLLHFAMPDVERISVDAFLRYGPEGKKAGAAAGKRYMTLDQYNRHLRHGLAKIRIAIIQYLDEQSASALRNRPGDRRAANSN